MKKNAGNRNLVSIVLMLGAVAFALTGCSGGGGGGGGTPTPVSYTIGGTVSGLTGTGLVLQNNGGDNLAISGNGTFTFATSLANQGSYAVTVLTQPGGPAQTCAVTNGSGTIAGANVTNVAVNCGSANKAWGTAARIESGVYDAYSPQIAMDGNGNAFAVWRQNYTDPNTGFSGYVVWAGRYSAGSGWHPAEIINNGYLDSGFPPLYAQIAMDANGNAIAVWEQYDPGAAGNTNITSIWANRYTAGTGWGTAQLIETTAASWFYSPRIGFDASGNALVVWFQNSSFTSHDVWANRYTVGTGWGTATQIDNGKPASNAPPLLAVDATGNAIAVWAQSNGAIGANRYTAGTGWGTATSLVTSGRDVQIAMNANGDAYLVWRHYDSVSSSFSTWSKRYAAGTGFGAGWQPDESIDTTGYGAPQIAIAANGDAFAVWTRYDGATYHIYTAKHPALTTWGTTVRIDSDTGGAGTPQVGVNGNGDAFAVWVQYDGTRYNIWSNRRLATDTGWGTAELIETDNAGFAYDPQIVVDANGNALAVWRQNDGTRDNIWANCYQ